MCGTIMSSGDIEIPIPILSGLLKRTFFLRANEQQVFCPRTPDVEVGGAEQRHAVGLDYIGHDNSICCWRRTSGGQGSAGLQTCWNAAVRSMQAKGRELHARNGGSPCDVAATLPASAPDDHRQIPAVTCSRQGRQLTPPEPEKRAQSCSTRRHAGSQHPRRT